MPISNEIIELEPVKKGKLKFIISIVIAAVMLALAVTFLVMYIIKPAAEEYTGKVNGVSVTHTELFDTGETDGSGNKVYTASAGNEYIVYAEANIEGDVSDGIRWDVSRNDALIDVKYDREKLEDGSLGRFFCSFTVNADFVASNGESVVSLTARSLADDDKRSTVYMKLVKQNTEHIILDRYSWRTKSSITNPSVNSSAFDIKGKSIDVAYIEGRDPTYTISFRQLGKYNSSTNEYSKISYVGGDNDVVVKSDNENILYIESQPRQSGPNVTTNSMMFKVRGTGTAKITFTAKDSGITQEITVNIKSCEALGYIEDIYFSPTPVTKDFFTQEGLTDDNIGQYIQKGDLNLVRPTLAMTYDNIYNHIIIKPLSVQFDEAKGEMKTDWQNKIKIESDSSKSKKDAVTITRMSTYTRIMTNQLSKASECALIITDDSQEKMGARASVGVNIVAGNTSGTAELKNGSIVYNDKQIEDGFKDGIAASQATSFVFNVRFNFTAPAEQNIDTMIDYVSKSYKFENVSNGVKIYLGTTELTGGTVYTLNKNDFTVTQGADKNTYYGEVSFRIGFDNDMSAGQCGFTFTKIGSDIPFFSSQNSAWSKRVRFKIAIDPDTAYFIPTQNITDIVTKSGNQTGHFYPANPTAERKTDSEGNAYYEGSLDVYVQHLGKQIPVWFKPEDFIDKNSESGTIEASNILINTVISNDNSGNLIFGGDLSSDAAVKSTVTVKNINGRIIGKFNINVYVFDAYKEIKCKNADSETHQYSAKEASAADYYGKVVVKDELLANKLKVETEFAAYTGKLDVDIEYGSGNSLLGKWNDSKTEKLFYIGGTTAAPQGEPLFKYTRAGLTPMVDLFAYSYNNNADVSRITVIYKPTDIDSWLLPTDFSCRRAHVFERRTDGVKLFSTNKFDEGSEISSAGDVFSHNANHNTNITLYLSSIVDIGNGTLVVARKAINDSRTVAAYTLAYFDVKGGETEGVSAGKYRELSFKTPELTNEPSKTITFSLEINGIASNKRVNVVVSNEARDVAKIEFFDADGSTSVAALSEADLSSLNSIVFGKFISSDTDCYGKPVHMKITYVAYDASKHNSFAPVTLTFPKHVRLVLDGVTVDESCEHTFIKDKSSIADANAVLWVENMRFELIKEKIMSSDATSGSTLEQWNGTIKAVGNDQVANINISVGTSVMEIKYQQYDLADRRPIDDGFTSGENEVHLNMALDGTDKAAVDGAAQSLRLRYFTYAANDGYSNWFDTLTNSTGAYGSGYYVNGILFNKEMMNPVIFKKQADGTYTEDKGTLIWDLNKETRIITVKPNIANLVAGVQEFKIELTDRSNKESENGKTFTLKIVVTVSFNVFSVDQAAEQYNIPTSGKAGDNTYAEANGRIVYNYGNAAYAPASTDGVRVYLEKKTGDNSFESYESSDMNVAFTNTNFTVKVKNSVTGISDLLYITVDHNGKISRKPLYISTSSTGIRLKAGGISVSGNVANVNVTGSVNNFAIAAEAYNLGSGSVIGDAVGYGLFTDPACNTAASYAEYVNGNIVFKTGAGTDGAVYLKAYLKDEDGNENTAVAPLVITVNYTIDIGNVVLDDILVGSSLPTLLFYGGASTYFDLDGHIKATTVLGDVISGATNAVAVKDGNLTVSGFEVRAGSSQGGTITVTATYNGKSQSKDYIVSARTVELTNLTASAYSATVNIAESDSATVKWMCKTINGMSNVLSFNAVAAGNKFTVSTAADNTSTITVNRSAFTSADYKEHKFTATLTYASSSDAVKGSIVLTREFALTVSGEYKPAFTLTKGSGDISDNSEIAWKDNQSSEFTINVADPKEDATYGVEVKSGNDVINVNGMKFTLSGSAYGEVKFVVKTALYGKTYVSDEFTLKVTNGGALTSGLYKGNTSVAAADTEVIDYTDTAPTFTYKVDTSDIGSAVDSGNVKIIYTGDVTATSLIKDGNIFYMTFTVAKETTLSVSGTVVVNGAAYHLTSRKVVFTATKPAFSASVNKTGISSGETATVSVSKTNLADLAFGYDVAFEIVGDMSQYVTVNAASGVITAKTITADRNVTVRATITIRNGAYAGDVYTIDTDVALEATQKDIIFDYGYDGIEKSVKQTVGVYFALPVEPVRTGYTFGGWYTDTSFTSDKQVTADTVCAAEHSKLVAKWTAQTYNITFDTDGGSAVTSTTATYGETYSLPNTSKAGYSFIGWYTSAGIKLQTGDTVRIAENIILTARWAADEYTLTFDAVGGTVTPASKNVKHDGVYGTLPNPVKDGNTFIGWYTQAEGGVVVTSETIVTGDATVYAHWDANVYTVYINYNGYDTTDEPLSKQIAHGDAYALGNLTRAGYVFGGWYTDNAFANKIESDTVCTESGTVYAKWTANTYTVRFHSNGGNNPSQSSKNVTFGQPYGDLATVTKTPIGNWWNQITYTFAGWYYSESGDSVRVTSDSIVDRVPATGTYIDLYARWNSTSADESYVIAFNGNGGTVSTNFIRVGRNQIGNSMPADPTRTGYSFVGWFTTSAQTGGTQITRNSTVSEDTTVYARWTAETYELTFNANGGTIVTAKHTVKYDGTYGALPETSKSGYTFDGWYTLSGAKVEAGDVVRITENTELTARWTVKEYIVVVDYNGGSGNKAFLRVNHGDALDTALSAVTVTAPIGYTFDGWYTARTGGDLIADQTATADTTVYARWTAETYRLTFDTDGGSAVTGEYTATYDDAYGVLPETSKTGYTFDGWYTPSGDKVETGDVVRITENTKLTARWTVNTYTVSFDAGEVGVSPSYKDVIFGDTYGEMPEPVRDGFTFDGWFTTADGGAQVTDTDTVDITSDTTLYAHWTEIVI